MTFRAHTVLAVVPARGGSKGIPRKNLCKIGGRSLVAHAARVIAALEWIDAAVLSTDDAEITEEGRRNRLDVPFMRPPELADDRADSISVWRHAWLASETHFGCRFDLSVLLEPTSPMRRPEDIESALNTLLDGGTKAVVSVSRTPAHYTPERTLRIDSEGLVGPYLRDGLRYTARQTIPPYYHRNGIVYAVTRASLVDEKNLMKNSCAAVVIEREVVNIDTPRDLAWAAFLMDSSE